MTFSFLGGAGGAGTGGSIWKYLTKTFSNSVPSSSDFIELWDASDPLLPEPTSAHVMFYAQSGWKNVNTASAREDYPPACGAAFGYRHYFQGEIPNKLYGWQGYAMLSYPYDYMDNKRFAGINTTASLSGSMLIPNPGGQSYFHKSNFIAPDAESHYEGDWTRVFNGGNGHYWDRPSFPVVPNYDGTGSCGSFFGRGYDGGHYPGGSGGPGTDTARGPVATKIADGVLDVMGVFKWFVKGKSQDNNHGDNGEFEIVMPPDLFLFGQAPFHYDASLLKFPSCTPPGDRTEHTSHDATLAVILEFSE